MNKYQEMYQAVEASRTAAKGMRDAINKMEETAKPYGKEFLIAANKWASMNRKLVPEEARMAVSILIDDL